ncbi:MAG: hypothetical protein RLZZ46_788 [Bacteroidota bacterium]
MLLEAANTGFPWIPLPDGVEIFFVLSGFLIGQILLRSYLEHGFFTRESVMHFLKRRWFRTLPNYYLVLLLNLAFLYLGFIDGDKEKVKPAFLVFAQNLYSPLEGFFWESWSLSVEEWFYLCFPLILFLISYLSKNKTSERKFLLALTVFTLIPPILRYLKAEMMVVDDYSWDIHFRKMVPLRLDSIAAGVWCAWLKHQFPRHWGKGKLWMMLAGMGLFFWLETHPMPVDTLYNKVIRFSLSSWFFAACLPYFDQIRSGSGVWYRFFTFTSKISYSMYLVNLGLIAQVIIKQVKTPGNIHTVEQAWIWYGVFWILVYMSSYLLYRYWEKPMTELRERL